MSCQMVLFVLLHSLNHGKIALYMSLETRIILQLRNVYILERSSS
jgi:hypothetical protein